MYSLSAEAAAWLKSGDRGLSSNSLFSILYGVHERSMLRTSPADSGDFARCRKMVEAIPGAATLLLGVADVRATPTDRQVILGVIDHWQVLCEIMDREKLAGVDSLSVEHKHPRLNAAISHIWASNGEFLAAAQVSEHGDGTSGQDLMCALTAARRTLHLRDPAARAVHDSRVNFFSAAPLPPLLSSSVKAFDLYQQGCMLLATAGAQFGDPAFEDRAGRLYYQLRRSLDPSTTMRPRMTVARSRLTRRGLHGIATFFWRESAPDATGRLSETAKHSWKFYQSIYSLMRENVVASVPSAAVPAVKRRSAKC